MKIKKEDFKIDWFSGTGKGGQHRNKHQNCCRVTHVPTGIKAQGTENRSRVANERIARAVCISRIIDKFTKKTERYLAGEERVRTYHEPDNRVTDHASGFELSYKEVVEKCDLSKMIEARKKSKILD